MCHAEARAQDARRRACRHRLKMVGPSKASPTQRHNDRGADRATARYYPPLAGSPSRSPDRGPGGESQFFAAPPESHSTRPLDTPRAGFMGRDGGRAPPACAQHQPRQGFTSVCWRRLSPPTPPDPPPEQAQHSRTTPEPEPPMHDVLRGPADQPPRSPTRLLLAPCQTGRETHGAPRTPGRPRTSHQRRTPRTAPAAVSTPTHLPFGMS